MTCTHPIDAALLADYWLGLMTDEEEVSVETHLFGCDRCSARLREAIALAEEVRRLAGEGSLRMIVTDAFLTQAAARGRRVREYAPLPGGSVACTVTPRDDLLVSRLAANLGSAERVDLSLCDERGVEQLRLEDIPFRADAGGVVCQESITFARALPDSTLVARLVGIDASGDARVLGEYTFHHTRAQTDAGPADRDLP